MDAISVISSILVLPPISGLLATLISNVKPVKPEIPGLLFHSVLSSPGLNMSHLRVDIFESFLKHISDQRIKTLTLRDTNQNHNTKTCLLTFDDGLESVFTYALPLLEKFNQKMTIFCVSGFCNKNTSWDIFTNQQHLSTSQIRQISDLGHEIGSHTSTHANLPFLNDKDLKTELIDSKQKLEDITGKEITSLSFPYGGWNKRVWSTALTLGYKSSTLYRNHSSKLPGQFPVYGVYRFDSVESIVERIASSHLFSYSHTTAKLMSQFSKGSPVWKFRKSYSRIH